MDIITINKSLVFIEKHLRELVDVQKIADHVGYSSFHFARMFSEAVGLSLKHYINTRKVMHVLYEAKGDKSLINAAFDYGYEDYSSFYKACKRVYGKSPKACLESLHMKQPEVFLLGKERYPMITEQKLKTIIKKWPLDHYEINNIYSENGKVRKDHFLVGGYRVIVTNNYNKVLESKRISDSLREAGIKTPKYLLNDEGSHYVSYEDQYIVLVEEMEQKPYLLENIKASERVRQALGQAVASLHLALEPLENFEADSDAYDTCMRWAFDIVKDLEVESPLAEEFFKEFESYGPKFKTLPHQIIHRNPHMHNIFFKNGDLRGFGDLHLTTHDIRLFDLCYLCTSILAEVKMDPMMWLEQYQDIISGYNKIIKLSPEETHAIPYMMYAIQMIVIAYFATQDGHKDLAIKNYESLKWMKENLV